MVIVESYNRAVGREPRSDGQVAARITLNDLLSSKSQISQKAAEGDRDHLKWFLNSEECRPYRTFKGTV